MVKNFFATAKGLEPYSKADVLKWLDGQPEALKKQLASSVPAPPAAKSPAKAAAKPAAKAPPAAKAAPKQVAWTPGNLSADLERCGFRCTESETETVHAR